MGKRKSYKAAYGGKGASADAKRFKYSAMSVNSDQSTPRGFLFSYRRNTLQKSMREAFFTVKHFTNLVHPGLIDQFEGFLIFWKFENN